MIDIHGTDPATGYSVERHMLDELAAAGEAGLSASDLANMLGDISSAAVGQWLRELRVRGLVVSESVTPGSTRVRWKSMAIIDIDQELRDHLETVRREEREPIELVPRDLANRYRIYRVRDGEQQLIATTAEPEGIGTTLVTLAEEGEFEDAAVGVLDTRGAPRGSGVWIVSPYVCGRGGHH